MSKPSISDIMKSPVSSDKKVLANAAVVGKLTRACDNCARKRARWYCASDDAFLCQSCDSSVHSANPLARRHERIRLKTASVNESKPNSAPSWFPKKARTPRQKKNGRLNFHNPLVPEICSEDHSHEENDEQLLFRVPIFDPFVAELCGSANSNTVQNFKGASSEFSHEMNHFESELDLAEFAADVESLLGKGFEDESFDIEGLGLLDCDERIKVEDEEIGVVAVVQANHQTHGELETFDLNFDYSSPAACEEEENKAQNQEAIFRSNVDQSKKTFLKLDYEGIMSVWDEQKSPWTTGERPELNSGDCWPDYLGTSGTTMHVYEDMGLMMSGHTAATADGGREARVSRYREKRRTRLFSKKIRYEVRKLNAEKRPRMKGRFVKRANFAASDFPLLNK